jgi:isoleucyl-tRNA synthetase
MKDAAALIAAFGPDEIAAIEKSNTYALSINGDTFEITLEDIEIVTEDIPGWQVATDAELVVALDLTLTDELTAEGYARDLVNRIQNVRKEKGFNVTDRISVTVSSHPDIEKAVSGYADYIKAETLAESLAVGESQNGIEVDWLDERTIKVDATVV